MPASSSFCAEPQDDAVVVARVRVFDGFKILLGDFSSRIGHQLRMEAKLRLARFLDRMDLRPQVVGAQEVVGDPQPAGRVAF